MNIWKQKQGAWVKDEKIIAFGYSGKGLGRNNPLMQETRALGPIPCGEYTIEPPRDTDSHGPFVMPLTPAPGNRMWGRSAFLIHGDNKLHDASLGCIILPRNVREQIWASGDRALTVISGV